MKLIKKIYGYDELLSKETKDKVLKYKRRIEYFGIFIPLMFIITGYLVNSIITKDYTNFKLFYRFTEDFLYKVNFNIFPIGLIFVLVLVWILTMYKTNIVYLFWSSLIVLSSLYIFVPGADGFIIELVYQVNLIVNEYNLLIVPVLSILVIMVMLYSRKVRIRFTMLMRNGIELFLFISAIYLEAIGDYKLLFFLKSFIQLFINSIRFFTGMWEIAITAFVSLVFLSLYNKQFISLMFFIKNKITLKNELQVTKGYGELSNMDIIQVSDRVKMPLLKHEWLPKVGVIVPAYNEETTICDTVDSLLNIDYSKGEILTVVVSDGSTDDTLEVLKRRYDMYEIYIDQTYKLLNHKQARATYVSDIYNNLILVDKPNGGKADALNLGLEYLPKDVEYVSVIDADSVVDKQAFRILATNAEKDNKIAALTGTILPRESEDRSDLSLITNVQLFDYLNSFHGERGALGLLNAIMIVPGAFGFFKKDVLMDVEGYPQDVLAEDGLLTINIHRKRDVKIKFIPEAVSYTQVPSTITDLRKQRIRWFKGLTELLNQLRYRWKENLRLSLVFMDYLLIEWVTPIMAPIGVCVIIANPQMITYPIFHVFMTLAIVTPLIQGMLCMLMESSYRKVNFWKLMYLPLTVLISPFLVLWRNDALLDLRNRGWGVIKRY